MSMLEAGDNDELIAAVVKGSLRDMDPPARAWFLALATAPGNWPRELAAYVANGYDIDVDAALSYAYGLVRELAGQRWETNRWIRSELTQELGSHQTDPRVLEWYLYGAQRADALMTGPRPRCLEPLPEPQAGDDLPRFVDWGEALDWLDAETVPLKGLFRRAAAVGDHEMVCRLYDVLVVMLGPGGEHSTHGEFHAAARAAAMELNRSRAIAVVSVAEAEIQLAAGNLDAALTCLDAAGDVERLRAEIQRVRGTVYARLANETGGTDQRARYNTMAVEHLRKAIEIGDARTGARARLVLADREGVESHALLTRALADLDSSADRQAYHVVGEAMVSLAIHKTRDGDFDEAIAAINTAGAHLGAVVGGRERLPLLMAHRLYVECGKSMAANGKTLAAKECFTVAHRMYADRGMGLMPEAREVSAFLEGHQDAAAAAAPDRSTMRLDR